MDFHLHKLLIHELEKASDMADAQVFLSESALLIGEQESELIEKLDHTFVQKADTIYGYFSPPEDALFPGYFRILAEEQFGEEAFVNFSRDTMNALQLALQGVIGAKGGYLVYADYQVVETRLISIFLVRDKEGLVFRKDENGQNFQLDTVTYLNTDKLAMACRIHVDKYLQGQERCLEVIKHAKSQKEISEYFLNWIGLDRPETSRNLTETFLQVVEELPLPVEEDSGEPMAEHKFREEVVNFALRSPRKTIKIDEFDQHFYGEEQKTRQYLQEHQVELDPEFRFDKRMVKQLYYFRAAAEGISLGFTRDHLQNGQVIIEDDKIEIRCEELALKLLELIG